MLELWGYGEYTGKGAGPAMVTTTIYAHVPLLVQSHDAKVRFLTTLLGSNSTMDVIKKSPAQDLVDQVEAERTKETADPERTDKATAVLRQAGRYIELTPENNKRVLRKIDTHILPVILAVYFLQAIDKATLAYASVFGLVEGANLHGLQYSWLGSVVYLAQLVAQPLVAYLLVKLPLGKFLAATVLLWGIILSVMPAANTFAGLLVTRMLLGLFEAGVAPTFIA
ncbi:MAG: hypothetical protein M1823_006999, partial [Watsoniomyces obsoletus]